MPRKTDHEARRKDILLNTIELYLNTAMPVSSDALRRARKKDLSTASLRSVFSDLEEAGYLNHPHTSAGRVPTDDGYRYYINALMKKTNLNSQEIEFINKIYEIKVQEREDLFEETSSFMSDVTHYASVVYFLDQDEQKVYFKGFRYILEHPEFQDVQMAHMVFEVLERKEKLLDLITSNFSDKTRVYIGKECACPQMEHCSVVVSRYGSSRQSDGRLALIGPKRMAYDKVIPFMDYVADVLTETLDHF
ncbi:MAG: hypothetical protein V1863_01140 [Candidatus Omnitrophota bacterium]